MLNKYLPAYFFKTLFICSKAFFNIPDVFFRIVEDYEDQRFEFFSYDTYDGLIQYAKNGNYDDTEKRGLYAFLSAEDRLTVLEIVEKYRAFTNVDTI